MKVVKHSFYLILVLLMSRPGFAQLTVSGGMTPQQMVQNVLLGTGVSASNINYTGANIAIGTFNGSNSNIGLNSGVLITTGSIYNAPGPNNLPDAQLDNGLPGDPALDSISGVPTHDAASLEFDFVPLADTIRFRYVFASEEYNEFVCAMVNDVFAFFISGPGITGQQNIALIPGTSTPVSINTVNVGSVGSSGSPGPGCILSNFGYFVNNDNPPGLTVQYDGFTTVLTAQAVVTPCVTYHIRLVIADGNDGIYDSGVFLEAGSFSGVNPVVATADPTSGFQLATGILGCAPFQATFDNSSTGTNHFIWDFGDGTLPDTASNPSHLYLQGGVYTVQLIAADTSACHSSDTAYFTFLLDSGLVSAGFNLNSTGICDTLHIDVTSTSSGVQLYSWDFDDGGRAIGPNSNHTYSVPGTYHVYHIVTDTICHVVDTITQSVTLLPRLHSVINLDHDVGCTPLSVSLCDAGNFTSATSYQWDFGNSRSSSNQCDRTVFSNAGFYTIKLQVTDSAFCNIIDISTADVHAKITPDAAFSAPDSQNLYEPAQFTNLSRDGLSFNWNFGDGENAFIENPSHQYIVAGMYTICMKAMQDGCEDTACHLVNVFETPLGVWLPSGFTPNGDGRNDLFAAVGTGIESFALTVFNRWGNKVFESDIYSSGWDGKINGYPASAGVYVYHLKATLLNHQTVEKYGTVTISQ